jgi:cytochrome c biogenesis protein CcdA
MINYLELSAAFLEGFLITVSPCVLSILPIVLSSSIEGGKWRPTGVVIGLMSSFVFFSFFLGQIFQTIGVRPELMRLFASAMIFFFGFTMVFSSVGDRFQSFTSALSRIGGSISNFAHNITSFHGLLSGLIVGVSLGLIWTPCIGPMLGTAMAQAASQVSPFSNFLIIASFCCGVALPMLVISVLGKVLVNQVNFFKQNSKKLQQVFGSIILLSVIVSAKPSIAFVENWVKANILGDKSVSIAAVTLDTFKPGCKLDI